MKQLYLLRMWCIIFVLFSIQYTHAQKDTLLPDPEAYFVSIIVNNIDTSLNWYVEKLGFQVLNKVEMKERGFQQANLKRGTVLIELLELSTSIESADIAAQYGHKAKVNGFFKFGFLVNRFDSWISYLQATNVKFHGKVVKDPISNKKMVLIKDPDGNRIQIFEK